MDTKACLSLLVLVLMASSVAGRRKPRPPIPELPDEYRLMKDLMEKAQTWNPTGAVRPVSNTSVTIKVAFGLALLSINNIDRVSGLAEFKLWQRYAWHDATLSWSPEDYGGIDHIRVPMGKPMWKPDLVLYNSVNIGEPYNEDVLGVLSSDGALLFIPPAMNKVKCEIIEGGIFTGKDVANCTFKYGSWTYDGFKLDVDLYDGLGKIDLTDTMADPRYKVLSSDAEKNVKYYPCCEEPYPDLTFNLEVELL